MPSAPAGAIPSLDSLEVTGKRVLVRADLNVPLKDGLPTDRLRIDRLLPTLEELAGKRARVIVISHLGRPRGEADAALSLAPVAGALAEALALPVAFAEDCIGPAAKKAVAALAGGEITLLENLRFHPGEEANDPDFARALASLAECYVNDAFSCAHRGHASVAALPRLLPAAAGRGMMAELAALGRLMGDAARPLAAVIGGAKVSTKMAVLEHLTVRADILAIGGAMANTFLLARGYAIGASLCEPTLAGAARAILARAGDAGCEVMLPSDVIVAHDDLASAAAYRTVAAAAVPEGDMILDIGPASAGALAARLERARTVVWNGPLGAFETPPFDAGTAAVARAVAKLTAAGRLVSIAGGGETLAALAACGAAGSFTYLSAAGGAFLEWLEGKTLPGVAALQRAPAKAI